MSLRQRRGTTLGLAIALVLVIIIFGIAFFVMSKYIGGNREVLNAADAGALNAAREMLAVNIPASSVPSAFQGLGVNVPADPNAKDSSGNTLAPGAPDSISGKYNIFSYNRAAGMVVQIALNASEDPTNTTAKNNVAAAITDLATFGSTLNQAIKDSGKACSNNPVVSRAFQSMAQSNGTNLTGATIISNNASSGNSSGPASGSSANTNTLSYGNVQFAPVQTGQSDAGTSNVYFPRAITANNPTLQKMIGDHATGPNKSVARIDGDSNAPSYTNVRPFESGDSLTYAYNETNMSGSNGIVIPNINDNNPIYFTAIKIGNPNLIDSAKFNKAAQDAANPTTNYAGYAPFNAVQGSATQTTNTNQQQDPNNNNQPLKLTNSVSAIVGSLYNQYPITFPHGYICLYNEKGARTNNPILKTGGTTPAGNVLSIANSSIDGSGSILNNELYNGIGGGDGQGSGGGGVYYSFKAAIGGPVDLINPTLSAPNPNWQASIPVFGTGSGTIPVFQAWEAYNLTNKYSPDTSADHAQKYRSDAYNILVANGAALGNCGNYCDDENRDARLDPMAGATQSAGTKATLNKNNNTQDFYKEKNIYANCAWVPSSGMRVTSNFGQQAQRPNMLGIMDYSTEYDPLTGMTYSNDMQGTQACTTASFEAGGEFNGDANFNTTENDFWDANCANLISLYLIGNYGSGGLGIPLSSANSLTSLEALKAEVNTQWLNCFENYWFMDSIDPAISGFVTQNQSHLSNYDSNGFGHYTYTTDGTEYQNDTGSKTYDRYNGSYASYYNKNNGGSWITDDFGTVATPGALLNQIINNNGAANTPDNLTNSPDWENPTTPLGRLLQRCREILPTVDGPTIAKLLYLQDYTMNLGEYEYIYLDSRTNMLAIVKTNNPNFPWFIQKNSDGSPVNPPDGTAWPKWQNSTFTGANNNEVNSRKGVNGNLYGDCGLHDMPFETFNGQINTYDYALWVPSSGANNMLGELVFKNHVDTGFTAGNKKDTATFSGPQ